MRKRVYPFLAELAEQSLLQSDEWQQLPAVRAGAVTVPFVASDPNLADLLTTSICTPRFSQLAARLRAWTMAC